MKFDVNTIDTLYRRLLVVVSTTLGVIDYFIVEPHPILHASFVVMMAGVVGYYTNYLAIYNILTISKIFYNTSSII